ncbi:Isocitrate dehydrogenase (NADP) [Desulfovibrionales bacterium]
MAKISVKTALVELDGDEMTRIMWKMIKDKLLFPYLNLPLRYFDLGIKHRDIVDDRVTIEAVQAIKELKIGVKCATITPTAARVKEYSLKKQWKSPNGTIRAMLDGTVFRAPILVRNVAPVVKCWTKPIVIGRHAYGDVYKNVELRVPGAGKAELIYMPADGGPKMRVLVHKFKGPGIIQGIHNTDSSIYSFARACFAYALDRKIDVWFGVKDTISKTYDSRFRDIFEEEYVRVRPEMEAAGLSYFATLIDDVVARAVMSAGGFLWACKNYDGDVMSDMIASAFGSLAMMTSILVSPDGCFEYEAAHGTVQRHYYRHMKGETTSTNPMALIFAWSGALRKRGELDGTSDVVRFADILESTALGTIEDNIMTADLACIANPKPAGHVDTKGFIDIVAARLQVALQES